MLYILCINFYAVIGVVGKGRTSSLGKNYFYCYQQLFGIKNVFICRGHFSSHFCHRESSTNTFFNFMLSMHVERVSQLREIDYKELMQMQ